MYLRKNCYFYFFLVFISCSCGAQPIIKKAQKVQGKIIVQQALEPVLFQDDLFLCSAQEAQEAQDLLAEKEADTLELFCLCSMFGEFSKVIRLLDYGLQMINEYSFCEELEALGKAIERDFCKFEYDENSGTPDLSSLCGDKEFRLRKIVLNVAQKIYFSYKINEARRTANLHERMLIYLPFMVDFLGYCLEHTPGNLFENKQSVFDETTRDYIDIKQIMDILTTQLSAYEKLHAYDYKSIQVSRLIIDNTKLQARGKLVLDQIQKRHKKRELKKPIVKK